MSHFMGIWLTTHESTKRKYSVSPFAEFWLMTGCGVEHDERVPWAISFRFDQNGIITKLL